MNASIGSILRQARERKNLTRAQVAKKIKITEGYLGHLENDSHVHLSDDLTMRLIKALRVAIPKKTRETHNKRATKWYRDYRHKSA